MPLYLVNILANPVTGQNVIQPAADNVTGLRIKRHSVTQSADMFTIESASGALLKRFDANGNQISNGLNISFLGLTTPASVTVTPQGTPGGTTYGYRISAVNGQGETVAAASTTTATGNASLSVTNFNRVAWAAVAGATSYKVYGRTNGAELLIATVTAPTVQYDDTGAVTPAGALPTAPVGTALKLSRWASQTGDIATWYQNDGTTVLGSIDASGNLLFGTTNTKDVGSTASTPRNVYAGTQFLGAGAGPTSPDFAWVGHTTTGFGRNGDAIMSNHAGNRGIYFDQGQLTLPSGSALRWSANSDPTAAVDLLLLRDAADTLALRRGTNAQTFNIYSTFTDISNYVRFSIAGYANGMQLLTQVAGTGGNGNANLVLRAGGTSHLYLGASGGDKWVVQGSNGGLHAGDLVALSNNAYDIGDSAATGKPRTGYFGTSVIAPLIDNPSATLKLAPAASALSFFNVTGAGQQAGASQAGVAAILDANAKAAIAAIQAALFTFGLVTNPA